MARDHRDVLLESLIAFICERTGLQRGEVLAVFEADQEFWMHHQQDAKNLVFGSEPWGFEDEE